MGTRQGGEPWQGQHRKLLCSGGISSPALTLSPLLLSFQKGWMKSQEPSLPVASSVTHCPDIPNFLVIISLCSVRANF